ncbi:ABC transporter ATP-binding protein [Sporosarcina sp. Marseille-Q4063]|uniref:ABC transporter ATP-binding protein n=1 Tax=Sporosarcina sp. Marseille-Q4063 TaxID=2810514 RepID=UPI001BAFC515|nr:ABC transporter ATP-binding protein [Sporosarcina sp. Marseille-Q4063]QUW20835.1 ABC transporter ATP-binding protein [Sporosarcina sp. Marseille-Q4063]
MLKVNQLSIEINEKRIVDSSSFFVPRGRITSIIGESGSGKSMTVSALLDILPAGSNATGQALFANKNLLTLSDKEMSTIRGSQIFTIFQDAANSFNPSVKMGKQLYEFTGRRIQDGVTEFQAKMDDILNDLGLSKEIMEQYPFELSGGMLQRCMIACALYVEPELLIADEPTSALDTILQKEFIDLLKELNEKQGTTILLITHDLDIAAEVADEMVVMHKGKVVETGTVTELFERPKNAYTKRLLESRF